MSQQINFKEVVKQKIWALTKEGDVTKSRPDLLTVPEAGMLCVSVECLNWIPFIEKDFIVFYVQDFAEFQRNVLQFQCLCWGELNWKTQYFNSLCLNGGKKG